MFSDVVYSATPGVKSDALGQGTASNPAVPSSPTWWVRATFKAENPLAITDENAFLYMKSDPSASSGPSVAYNNLSQQLELNDSAGVTLDTLPWDLRTAAQGPATVIIAYDDPTSMITWKVNGTTLGTFADSGIPSEPGIVTLQFAQDLGTNATLLADVTATTGAPP